MRFLIDMNLSPGWARLIEEAGFEAIHWSTIGAHDAEDAVLLQWADEHDYIVLTNDLDFGAILAATRARRPSVLQIRGELLTPGVIGNMVIAAIRQTASDLQKGALVAVDVTRARVRILPIRD
jgi:predicted nuclease of predicted toxin-antitoxin system